MLMGMMQPGPLFTNDQFGIIRTLLFVVLPIIVSLGGTLYALDKRKERLDINGLGERVGRLETKVSGLDSGIAALAQTIDREKLATVTAVMDTKSELLTQLTDLKVTMARLDERNSVREELASVLKALTQKGNNA